MQGLSAMTSELFVGIDVSKDTFDVATVPASTHRTFSNDGRGISALVRELSKSGPQLVVMEATGGYQCALETKLWEREVPFAVVNPKRVRDFARGLGWIAKTDRIDAAILADYARKAELEPSVRPSEAVVHLKELVTRRRQLQKMVRQESNHLELATPAMARSINKVLKCFEKELATINKQIDAAIKADETLHEKARIMRSMPGVGRVFAFTALADLDELGRVCREVIAALVGVAPYNRDSGRSEGKRFCCGGRAELRKVLYMAALSATRHNRVIRDFYHRLLGNGKPPMVALVACMRKMLVILNAMIRDGKQWSPNTAHYA